MSLREEDRQKNSCPSRGLGLAAAAIGVGVGAALYYFFSKRSENPATEGSTSQSWNCESPQSLPNSDEDNHDSYITISENTTTDTSINESNFRYDSYWTPRSNISDGSEMGDVEFITDSNSITEEDLTSLSSHRRFTEDSFSRTDRPNSLFNNNNLFTTPSFTSHDLIDLSLIEADIDFRFTELHRLRTIYPTTISPINVRHYSYEERFRRSNSDEDNHDSYTTISENSTTDTSINESNSRYDSSGTTGTNTSDDSEMNDVEFITDSDSTTEEDLTSLSSHRGFTEVTFSGTDRPNPSFNINNHFTMPPFIRDALNELEFIETGNNVTLNELGMLRNSYPSTSSPTNFRPYSYEDILVRNERPELPQSEVYRDRDWSLEECSICFDRIVSTQEVMSLPCAHNFHQACILPWLEEQQTCPNCRKFIR